MVIHLESMKTRSLQPAYTMRLKQPPWSNVNKPALALGIVQDMHGIEIRERTDVARNISINSFFLNKFICTGQ